MPSHNPFPNGPFLVRRADRLSRARVAGTDYPFGGHSLEVTGKLILDEQVLFSRRSDRHVKSQGRAVSHGRGIQPGDNASGHPGGHADNGVAGRPLEVAAGAPSEPEKAFNQRSAP